MALKTAAKTGTGFQGVQPLVSSPRTGKAQQQRIMSQTLRISPALLGRITKHIKPLGPSATPDQQRKALRKLFDIIKIGGTLGITYQYAGKREPRTPEEAIKTGKADCDELAMLFVAAARHLNIPLTNVSMGSMQFKGAGGQTMGHAVLYVKTGAQNFVFDFTRSSPISVRDFNQATIQRAYNGTTVSYGPNAPGFKVTSTTSLRTYPTVADMAATQLLHRADYHNGQAKAAKTDAARLNAYDAARGSVEQAASLGSRHAFIVSTIGQQALTVFDGYHSMGESAYKAARRAGRSRSAADHYKRAMTYFDRAIRFYGSVPSLSRARATALHDIHEYRGLIHQAGRRYQAALAEYTKMVKLKPKGWSGHRKKMNMELTLARAALRRRDRTAARRYILAAEKTGREALSSIPDKPAMATHRSVIRNALTRVRGYMRQKGWSALP